MLISVFELLLENLRNFNF